MPEVNVEIAKRSYRLGCADGEEQRLASLAHRLDREATRIAGQMGQVNEGRLLVMSALMFADKLAEAEEAVTAAEARAAAAEARANGAGIGAEREAEIVANLDALSERIETLVGRIQDGA